MELDLISQTTKWKVGPFWIAPTIGLRNIGYDANVYGQREEDNPIGDYTATLSAQANVYLVFRQRLILSFLANPEYVYFVNETSESAWNRNFSPSLKLLVFSRFVLSGDYHYRKERRRATREFDVRSDERVKGYAGSLFYETARRTFFGVSGSVDRFSYEDTSLPGQEVYLSQQLNREQKSASFEINYRVFADSYVFFNGGYTDYQFENPVSYEKNSDSYQVYTGIRFPLLGRARGTISFGYKKFHPRQPQWQSFSGLVGSTDLYLRIRRFAFRAQYSRDCIFSYTRNNVYFVENRYGGGVSFYLNQYLRLDYDFSYGTNQYPEEVPVSLPDGGIQEIIRKDTYRSHSAGFGIRIIRNFGIGLVATLYDRNSNYPPADNRKRWFAGGYLIYEF